MAATSPVSSRLLYATAPGSCPPSPLGGAEPPSAAATHRHADGAACPGKTAAASAVMALCGAAASPTAPLMHSTARQLFPAAGSASTAPLLAAGTSGAATPLMMSAEDSLDALGLFVPLARQQQQQQQQEQLQQQLQALLSNPHQRSRQGRTALHEAAASGDVALVRALLESGADSSATDLAGVSAMDEAVAAERWETVEAMRATGAQVRKWEAADFSCAVCFNTYNRPVPNECGHCFCRSCLQQARRLANGCPVCRAPVRLAAGYAPHATLERLLALHQPDEYRRVRQESRETNAAENAIANLQQFCDALGFSDATFSERNACVVRVDNEFSLHLSFLPDKKSLFLYAAVLEGFAAAVRALTVAGPAGAPTTLATLRPLLEAAYRGRDVLGGGYGYLPQRDALVYHVELAMLDVPVTTLRVVSADFIGTVKAWRAQLRASSATFPIATTTTTTTTTTPGVVGQKRTDDEAACDSDADSVSSDDDAGRRSAKRWRSSMPPSAASTLAPPPMLLPPQPPPPPVPLPPGGGGGGGGGGSGGSSSSYFVAAASSSSTTTITTTTTTTTTTGTLTSVPCSPDRCDAGNDAMTAASASAVALQAADAIDRLEDDDERRQRRAAKALAHVRALIVRMSASSGGTAAAAPLPQEPHTLEAVAGNGDFALSLGGGLLAEYRAARDCLVLSAPLVQGVPHATAPELLLRLYVRLLQGSTFGQHMLGGGVGIACDSPRSDELVMHSVLQMRLVGDADHAALVDFAAKFHECIKQWQAVVADEIRAFAVQPQRATGALVAQAPAAIA